MDNDSKDGDNVSPPAKVVLPFFDKATGIKKEPVVPLEERPKPVGLLRIVMTQAFDG